LAGTTERAVGRYGSPKWGCMTVKISDPDSDTPLATWDADLAFVHLPEETQKEMLEDARRETHE